MQVRTLISNELGLCRGKLRFGRSQRGLSLRTLRNQFRGSQAYKKVSLLDAGTAINLDGIDEPGDLGIYIDCLVREQLSRQTHWRIQFL